jgi:hypothetical protein
MNEMALFGYCAIAVLITFGMDMARLGTRREKVYDGFDIFWDISFIIFLIYVWLG